MRHRFGFFRIFLADSEPSATRSDQSSDVRGPGTPYGPALDRPAATNCAGGDRVGAECERQNIEVSLFAHSLVRTIVIARRESEFVRSNS
jgi:hypothetical protein